MEITLSTTIVVLIICLMRLYLKYTDCKKQLFSSIKEYKHLKEDYSELLRDLRDEKNKNFLLKAAIEHRK